MRNFHQEEYERLKKKNKGKCDCLKIKALEGGDKDIALMITQLLCSCSKKTDVPETDG